MPVPQFSKNPEEGRSRLGATLLRLRQSLERSRQQEQQAQQLMVAFQERWRTHRDRIARQLQTIETELDRIYHPAEAGLPAPHINLAQLAKNTERREGVISMGLL